MEWLRKILRESAIVLLSGVVIAIVITMVWNSMHHPTLESFKGVYRSGTLREQVASAEQYLKWFSPDELTGVIEADNADGVCHSQAHALGRAVYKTNQNFSEAIKMCGNSCTFGCFHGVLMQMFATDSDTLGGVIEEESPQEYLAHVQKAAKDICTKPEVESVVRLRYCYHGLGHVFGYLNGVDIKKAVASCNIFNGNENIAASCRSGAFMEYLFSTTSAQLQNTKSAAPCDAFPTYTSSCYRYKAYGWIKVWGGTKAAIKACDSFGTNTMVCIRDTAEAASSPTLVSTAAGVESMCGGLEGKKRHACVTGALKKIIDLNDGDDSEHTCDGVAATFRDACLQVRTTYRGNIYLTNDPHIP